jgi:8-oxo-dGTP pyrophosphatase MutT (NUDIX family)
VWVDESWHLVLTRRTDRVEHHKGQVSFPGGGCETHDGSPEETALREAFEEIGLKSEDVRLLGRMDEMATNTQYRVTPVVGVMPWPYTLHLAEEEVERVFTIPLTWLAEARNWKEIPFTPGGETRSFPVVIYQQYDGEILWGVSGRIVVNLLNILGLV